MHCGQQYVQRQFMQKQNIHQTPNTKHQTLFTLFFVFFLLFFFWFYFVFLWIFSLPAKRQGAHHWTQLLLQFFFFFCKIVRKLWVAQNCVTFYTILQNIDTIRNNSRKKKNTKTQKKYQKVKTHSWHNFDRIVATGHNNCVVIRP